MSRRPTYQIKRKKKEIDQILAACEQAQLEGKTKFSAMTYEQGVLWGMKWLFGDEDAFHPLD